LRGPRLDRPLSKHLAAPAGEEQRPVLGRSALESVALKVPLEVVAYRFGVKPGDAMIFEDDPVYAP
jgi:hypothetical protein